MQNTENNTIIKIFKDKKDAFFNDYYGEHSLDELIGARVINNVAQIRLSLGSIFYGEENLKTISKLSPVIKKMKVNTFFEYRYVAVIDLIVNNVKNKEEHKKYWSEWNKHYPEFDENNQKEYPSIYLNYTNLKEDKNKKISKHSFYFVYESDLNLNPKDYPSFNIDGYDSIILEGSNIFYRIYEIFDLKDVKAKKAYEKYFNVDYGLDKFEKKIF